MNTDPIADYLTRIRNAIKANHEFVLIPYSKIKENITKILQKEKFIEKYESMNQTIKGSKSEKKFLKIYLLEGKKDIQFIRKSKPGQRLYIKKTDIKPVSRGFGIAIISTNKGIITGKEAYKEKTGGELLCEIY